MAALECEIVPSVPVAALTLSDSLTLKQKSFIHHYIETRNGRLAAELAGYSGNEATLRAMASETLAKPNVRAELLRILNPIADAEEVLARLTKYSRSSIADVLDGSGEFDIDYAKANHSDDLIKKLKIKRRIIPVKDGEPETEITHEIELHDAKDATIQLAKVHQLLTDKQQTELNLSDQDVTRLAESLVPAMIEAAQRARALKLAESTVSESPPASLTDGTVKQ
jgi:phage terminase small subunit